LLELLDNFSLSVPCEKLKLIITLKHVLWRWVRILPSKVIKREPSAWGYNWVNLSLGNINIETWASRLRAGHKADDLAL
jgi:hypothetical protein